MVIQLKLFNISKICWKSSGAWPQTTFYLLVIAISRTSKSKISNLAQPQTELLIYQSFQKEGWYLPEGVGGRLKIGTSA